MTGYFPIGYISKTKGLKGEVHLKYSVENAAKYLDTESVFLEIDRKPVPFFVLSLRVQPGKNTGSLLLEDVDSVEEARKLLGKQVYLPDAARIKEDEVSSYTSLEGFRVNDHRLGPLGFIEKVHTYPQGQVAAIRYKNKEVLFPLNEDFILKTDKQNRRLFVDLPEGLIEIYLD